MIEVRKSVTTDGVHVYRAKGECGKSLNCVAYEPQDNIDTSIYLTCFHDTNYGNAVPGSLPECVKCLTNICSELKGKKVASDTSNTK